MDQNDCEIRDGVLVKYHISGGGKPFHIPAGITAIGDNAFRGARNCPEHLVIPEGVVSIGDKAFCYTKGMITLTLPASLRTIGRSAFVNSSLREVRFEDGLEIIGPYAFYGCDCLEKVFFPSTLKMIRNKAFGSCSDLHRLILPASLTALESDAFSSEHMDFLCAPGIRVWEDYGDQESVEVLGLPGVPLSEIPPNLRNAAILGLAEWEGQGGKTDPAVRKTYLISIRRRLPRLQSVALKNLSLLSLMLRENLISRESAENLQRRAQQNGQQEASAMLLDYQNRCQPLDLDAELERTLQELETGDTGKVRFKADWVFGRKEDGTFCLHEYLGSNTYVAIPDSVEGAPITELGDRLFKDRRDLVYVTIPDSVHTIGVAAFEGCVNLAHVNMPDSLTRLGSWAFRNCRSLYEISLPAGLTAIFRGCFQNCTSLTEVRLPAELDRIDSEAFSGCTSLTSVSLASYPFPIVKSAFSRCSSLTHFEFPSGEKSLLHRICTIHPGTRRVSFASRDPEKFPEDWNLDLFRTCSRLTEIHFPAHVRSVDCNTFYSSMAIESWTSDPNNPWLYTDGPFLIAREGNILLLAVPALQGDVVLPEGVTEIRSRAFYRRYGITSVTIPASVQVIHREAFAQCGNLKKVVFLGAPKSVARTAFGKCPVRVVLPEGTEWIKEAPPERKKPEKPRYWWSW